MKFLEFAQIKPIKPLTPSQARITGKKQQIDMAKTALNKEQDLQKQQKDNERQRKAQKPKG